MDGNGMDRKIINKAKKRRRIIWISVVSVLVLLVGYQMVFGDKSSKLNVDTEKISIETVTRDFYKDYISVIGTVEPIETIFLDAIEGGRVEKICIDEGNLVKEGDVIIELSNNNLLLDISNNEAQVARAVNELRVARLQMESNKLQNKRFILELKYQLKQYERTFRNNEVLYKENHISQDQYELSKEQYEGAVERMDLLMETQKQDSIFRSIQVSSLDASVNRLVDNLEIIRRRLEYLNFRAPFDGELAQLVPEVGQVIGYGTRIGKINILTSYKLRVEIDEHYISSVIKGLPGDFDFAGETHSLVITKVYPEVQQGGRFAVDMVFTSGVPQQIRIGQTARIKLELGDPSTELLISRGGFYQSTGGQWVYIVDESGDFAYRRDIRIGRQNPRYYEVLEGLEEGERVIVSSYDNFGDADKLILK